MGNLNFPKSIFTLNCNGHLLTIDKPVVMGIINATPDSFYKQESGYNVNILFDQACKMIKDGAVILDIGGLSTRPGADTIPITEEINRVVPLIKMIRKNFPQQFISIDTYNSNVALAAFDAGADIINDISSGAIDNRMMKTVASLNLPYIMMHMQGIPKTMQQQPHYENISKELLEFFIKKIQLANDAGIKDMIVDVGFGFGKTVAHNYRLLKNLHLFKMLEKPLLAGISRKSMICRLLNITPPEALNGTTALHMLALNQGASILRVHDVKEAMEAIKMYDYYSAVE